MVPARAQQIFLKLRSVGIKHKMGKTEWKSGKKRAKMGKWVFKGASPLDIDTNSQNIMVTRERKLIVMDATNSY